MHTFQTNTKADPCCTARTIEETLRRRASAHERIARAFRKAAKQLNVAVKLLGEADANAQAQANALSRVNSNLRAQIQSLWDENDKLEAENGSLLAQVLGDDQMQAAE